MRKFVIALPAILIFCTPHARPTPAPTEMYKTDSHYPPAKETSSVFGSIIINPLFDAGNFPKTAPANGTGICTFGTGSPGVQTGNLNAYVVWYSNAGHPWNGTTKQIVRAWMTGIASSPFWTTLTQYQSASGSSVGSMVLAGECDDPETEGNFFNCLAGDAASAVINNNTVGGSGPCNLPVDTQGVYFTMPSFTDVGLAGAGGCHEFASIHGSNLDIMVALAANVVAGQAAVVVSPNGFPLVDGQLHIFSHELGEAVADVNGPHGWTCVGTSSEIADVCENPGGTMHGWSYTTAGGQPASWGLTYQGTHYDFLSQVLWQLAASTCAANYIRTLFYGRPCTTNGDCYDYQWIGRCNAGTCAVPTCTDGVQDGDESDVDCGGSCYPNAASPTSADYCATGKKCRSAGDCLSGVCTAGICG